MTDGTGSKSFARQGGGGDTKRIKLLKPQHQRNALLLKRKTGHPHMKIDNKPEHLFKRPKKISVGQEVGQMAGLDM